jgi:thiamine phosphate synthase YjbQ (UPF0047 family)
MPATAWTSSPFYQFLFLILFILAFFPSAFHLLIKSPLIPFSSTHPKSLTAAHPSSPSCPAHRPPAAQYTTSTHSANSTEGRKEEEEEKMSSWFQRSFTLPPRSRGSYLVTGEVVSALPEISSYKVGLLNLFVQHTSCALSMNENWDEEVREDMSDALDRIAPEDRKGNLYRHAAEGSDDMPVRKRRLRVTTLQPLLEKDGALFRFVLFLLLYAAFTSYLIDFVCACTRSVVLFLSFFSESILLRLRWGSVWNGIGMCFLTTDQTNAIFSLICIIRFHTYLNIHTYTLPLCFSRT